MFYGTPLRNIVVITRKIILTYLHYGVICIYCMTKRTSVQSFVKTFLCKEIKLKMYTIKYGPAFFVILLWRT